MATQLNRFYQLASDAIFRHDGTLDKLVGDQVMAFFGAPIHREDIRDGRLRPPWKSCAK